MIKVISVRFRTAGKIYFFDPVELPIEKGQNVIVETARGVEYGQVVGGVREVEDDRVVQPLKPVIRIATPEDDAQEQRNLDKKKEAFDICLEKIKKHGLDMKLVDAEYTFDNNKVLFYFTADGRIDFRELVKDLAAVFKTRIELRQIGVRDEIKLMGGIGICGRVLCCHTYLSEFIPVSIKMAKEQNLSLNPTKISGVCGRLMCCLKNEEEIYGELNRKLPNPGDFVTTDDGLRGEVHSVNVLRQLVKVIVTVGDEKEIKEYRGEQLQFRRKNRKDKADLSPEELKELEELERQEQLEIQEKEQRAQLTGAEAGGRHDRNNRQDRNNRPNRSNRENRENRENGNDRANRDNGNDRPNRDRRENRENRREGNDRPNRENRQEGNDRPNRENRQEGNDRPNRENRPRHNRHNNNRNKAEKKE